MRILAIDPGYDRLGIAVVEGDPSRPIVLISDCITPPRGTPALRLSYIMQHVQHYLSTYTPTALGIESLFFSKNVSTALGVAEARGVVLAVCGAAHVPVIECSPQQVKLSITGHGAADKKAVALMIPKLVTLPIKKRLDDELDAIAVGIAALAMGLPRA